MTKEEHIKYWLKSADFDYDVFKTLYSNSKYLYALFIAHLLTEKLVKAHWVKDNESDLPPKVHNLVYLIKQTKLILSQDSLDFCAQFNDFQIQGRYPDYQFNLHKMLTKRFADTIVLKFEELRKCLLDRIV